MLYICIVINIFNDKVNLIICYLCNRSCYMLKGLLLEWFFVFVEILMLILIKIILEWFNKIKIKFINF